MHTCREGISTCINTYIRVGRKMHAKRTSASGNGIKIHKRQHRTARTLQTHLLANRSIQDLREYIETYNRTRSINRVGKLNTVSEREKHRLSNTSHNETARTRRTRLENMNLALLDMVNHFLTPSLRKYFLNLKNFLRANLKTIWSP